MIKHNWNPNEVDEMHSGRILLEDYLAPHGISVFHLAKDLGVSPRRIYEMVQGERSITPTMALRLAHYFDLSKRSWLDDSVPTMLRGCVAIERKPGTIAPSIA